MTHSAYESVDRAKRRSARRRKQFEIDRAVYKTRCLDCDYERSGMLVGQAAMSLARRHSKKNRHDVEITFSILDQPVDIIMADRLN